MNLIFKKAIVVILATLLFLGLFIGTNFVYLKYSVNQPLKTLLDQISFIKSYSLVQENSNDILKINLENSNLSFYEFERLILDNELIKNRIQIIEVNSLPNENLLSFYQEIHPNVYEALTLGNYTKLQDELKKYSDNINLSTTRLNITDDYIFLKLMDKEHFLFLIFEKNNNYPNVINKFGSDNL